MIRRLRLAPTVVALGLLAGCSGSVRLSAAAEGEAPASSDVVVPTAPECSAAQAALDPTRSYEPDGALPSPGAMPAGSTMATIATRGKLIVGVSGDTLLFGARNSLTNRIEGFDIDMLKEVAKAIFGPDGDSKITYKVITYADRLPNLEAGPDNGGVDIVAH
ncbi:MAG: transporter substrate-binding protein, partial [Ilumatobacteraceae bacterium]